MMDVDGAELPVGRASAGFAISPRPILSRGFHAGLGLLLGAVLIFGGLCAATSARAANSNVREIKRLLWVLGYGADRINGAATADTRKRISKFLIDQGGDSSASDEDVLIKLQAAYQKRRHETLTSEDVTHVIDRRAPDAYVSQMVVSPKEGLVLAGTCQRINRYRLNGSVPLTTFHNDGCGLHFVYSRSLAEIAAVARWDGDIYGVYIIDAKTGMRKDFIEIPNSRNFGGELSIDASGTQAVVFAGHYLWRVNLQTRAVDRIANVPGPVQILTDMVRVSADGRFVAATWSHMVHRNSRTGDSKFVYWIGLWSADTGRKIFEYRGNGTGTGNGAAFSRDGKYVALSLAGDVVEIREASNARLVQKRKFESGPSFSQTGGSVAFDSSDDVLLYYMSDDHGSGIAEWSIGSNTVKKLWNFPSDVDDTVVDPQTKRVYARVGAEVISYDLTSGKAIDHPSTIASLQPDSASISFNKKLIEVQTDASVSLVDLGTGGVRNIKVGDLKGDSMAVSAFLPNSHDILVGTSGGGIFKLDERTGKREDLARFGSQGIQKVVAARSKPLAVIEQLHPYVSHGPLDLRSTLMVIDTDTGRVIARTECLNQSNVGFVDDDRRILFTDVLPGNKWVAVVFDIASGRRIISRELKVGLVRHGRRTTWHWGSVQYVVRETPESNRYWVGIKSIVADVLYEYENEHLVVRQGGEVTGSTVHTWLPAGASAAANSSDGSLVLVIGKTPWVSRMNENKARSVHASLSEDPFAVASLGRDRFVTVDKSGEIRVYSRSQKNPVVRTLLYQRGKWFSRTEAGFIAGTREAAENLFLAEGPNKSVPLDNMFNALYRPDLVREALAGDPAGKVKRAAARLDLAKVMASGAALQVSIVSPTPGATNETDEIKVKASIASEGGGIGRIEWRVNGVTLGVERGLGRVMGSKPAAKTRTVERILSLEPGKNKIEVVAYNAKNLIASDLAALTIKWDGQRTAKPPHLWVVAVGVNDYYDGRLKLAYAVPDAKALAVAFEKGGAGLFGGVTVKTVLNDKVTTANLDRVFGDLGKQVSPRDVFVFFLAGHGKTEHGHYYFIPYDFKYQDKTSIAKQGIDQDRLQAWFSEIPARKSILLFDSCESGSLTGDHKRGSDIDERLGALARLTRATGRTFLTATTDDAPAMEGYHGHGLFTYAVLDALNKADTNHDGLINVTELTGYVDREVPELSYKAFKLHQLPQVNMVGSDFSLADKVDVLPASDNASAAPTIPTKPTHVVIASAAVYKAESETAALITTLKPGTQVTLVKTDAGWVLVAKDGVQLGYVEKKELVRLQ